MAGRHRHRAGADFLNHAAGRDRNLAFHHFWHHAGSLALDHLLAGFADHPARRHWDLTANRLADHAATSLGNHLRVLLTNHTAGRVANLTGGMHRNLTAHLVGYLDHVAFLNHAGAGNLFANLLGDAHRSVAGAGRHLARHRAAGSRLRAAGTRLRINRTLSRNLFDSAVARALDGVRHLMSFIGHLGDRHHRGHRLASVLGHGAVAGLSHGLIVTFDHIAHMLFVHRSASGVALGHLELFVHRSAHDMTLFDIVSFIHRSADRVVLHHIVALNDRSADRVTLSDHVCFRDWLTDGVVLLNVFGLVTGPIAGAGHRLDDGLITGAVLHLGVAAGDRGGTATIGRRPAATARLRRTGRQHSAQADNSNGPTTERGHHGITPSEMFQ